MLKHVKSSQIKSPISIHFCPNELRRPAEAWAEEFKPQFAKLVEELGVKLVRYPLVICHIAMENGP